MGRCDVVYVFDHEDGNSAKAERSVGNGKEIEVCESKDSESGQVSSYTSEEDRQVILKY